MTEAIDKDVKRLQDSLGRIGDKASSEAKAGAGKIIGHFADLIEGIEKAILPPTKTEQDSTKK